jgi:two-component system, OmpR family, response regulator
MSHLNYLLFIDHDPVSEDLKKYFAQFNIEIVQQDQLHSIQYESESPIAILIHWSILKNDPLSIHQYYTNYPVPLLIINDTMDEEACIKVLEAGADDFIVKPLYPRELYCGHNSKQNAKKKFLFFRTGDFILHQGAYSVILMKSSY